MAAEAVRIAVRGVVQGVGFRPFVYRIAVRCGLRGFVTNTPGSVVVHVEGPRAAIARFRSLFREEMPPAARVTRLSTRRVRPEGFGDFLIRDSARGGTALSTIPPDIALCAACRRELSDPDDRRYRYPFVNCTNCGPRFTIVRTLPYDRENTSMSAFPLCAACRKEYGDPLDRRFHAEPNACPKCGPRLAFTDRAGRREKTRDPVGRAAEALMTAVEIEEARGDLAAAISWMTANGVRVINYSRVSSYLMDGMGDGTSPYYNSDYALLDSAVSGGALFVASAGNSGQTTWTGTPSDADADGWVEFAGTDESDQITMEAGEVISVAARSDMFLKILLATSAPAALSASARSR